MCCCPSYAWPSKFYAVSVALMFASDMPDLKADSWRGWFKANAEDSQVSSGSQNQQPHFAVANLMPSKSPSCSWQAGRLPLRHRWRPTLGVHKPIPLFLLVSAWMSSAACIGRSQSRLTAQEPRVPAAPLTSQPDTPMSELCNGIHASKSEGLAMSFPAPTVLHSLCSD